MNRDTSRTKTIRESASISSKYSQQKENGCHQNNQSHQRKRSEVYISR